LEGDKESVEELFAKISIDPRHDSVIKLQSTYVEKRQFEKWSMGFKSYNKELKTLDNFNTEEFYCYVKTQLNDSNAVSLRILADFFDLNG
jgi:cytochrome oxidase Cu insertion factor (SCO1/SenC/PrrC family)